MASKDFRGGGGNRGLKILSREERDRDSSDRGRDDRGGRRDRDRDRRRDRDDRRRDGDAPTKVVQGPIVLLKRPDTKSSRNERPGEQRNVPSGSSNEAQQTSKSTPTLVLQRSANVKRDNEGGDQNEKGKPGAPLPITELLKPAYRFPGGQAMRLIDSNMKICSWNNFDYDANNYPGNMDYLVITAIGRPKVGKSSILSYLAGSEKFGTRKIFPPRSREEEMHTSVYISPDQIVLIEISSVYNQAATTELIPMVSQQGVLEVANVTWNLRLVRWALSISHVILIVSDNVLEPTVFQLFNSAEIIHPMDSALGEGSYPELIYICNKANLELIDKTELVDEFQKSFTSVTGRTPRIENNYFVLPHMKYETEHKRYDQFRNSLLEFSRYNRAPFAADKRGLSKLSQTNSIQDWFQNASRIWNEMNLPSYFSSYVKLLP